MPLQVLYHSEALPTTARILYRSFTPKRTGQGLAQDPYAAARAGVEPTTLRLKVIVSTKAPTRPTVGVISWSYSAETAGTLGFKGLRSYRRSVRYPYGEDDLWSQGSCWRETDE